MTSVKSDPARSIGGGLVVGAYAASPAHQSWDPEAESAFFEALAAIDGVSAFELPWTGSIHPHDDAWLHANFPAGLRAVITDIPFTMGRLGANPDFGLASLDSDGRQAAVREVAVLRDGVAAFNAAQGREVVGVVELHTAPRGQRGAVGPLAESLAEIAGWDWGEADLVIEHCDAHSPEHAPEKGFLPLADELDAIDESGADVGITLNWARSVIETRDILTADAHARLAAARGRLRGVIASGVAPVETAFGYPWIDAHLPFAVTEETPSGEPASLMTPELIGQWWQATGGSVWTGVKVGATAAMTLQQRIALVAESVAALRRVSVPTTR